MNCENELCECANCTCNPCTCTPDDPCGCAVNAEDHSKDWKGLV